MPSGEPSVLLSTSLLQTFLLLLLPSSDFKNLKKRMAISGGFIMSAQSAFLFLISHMAISGV